MERGKGFIEMQTCRKHHDSIRVLLADFPLVPPFDSGIVAALLGRLRTIIVAHLKLEDDYLYPLLEASDDRTVREGARRYREEMGSLSSDFSNLLSKWSAPDAIAADQAAFIAEWAAFRSKLEIRMAKEDFGLYKIAEEHLVGDVAGEHG